MMKLTVNGESKELAAGSTLASMLEQLGLNAKNIVIEHNGDVINKQIYDCTILTTGDSIEIVRFVGGG